MGIFGNKPKDEPNSTGGKDKVGQNPTGRERRSSAGKRRQEARKFEKDLKGSKWGKRGK